MILQIKLFILIQRYLKVLNLFIFYLFVESYKLLFKINSF